jgi:Ca2+-binding EF-hand superfamily protein
MNKYLLASLCLFASFAVQAQMPPPEEIMKDNDANKDGKITREEAAATPLANFFDLLDSNKDGVITMEELKNPGPPPG